ncbi:aminopeptidase N [Salinarimonas sp. NSM]|uniref:aminopeptidase N n=1 Tax=Salinarimonas sp. NSM TaxID=3458003 RepID=UPI004036205F
MRTETPQTVKLAEYRPSDFLIPRVALDIALDPHATRVRATLEIEPNPLGRADVPLALDGDDLVPVAISLDGAPLDAQAYTASADGLVIHRPPRRPFTLAVETRLDPTANTKLMGLYRSRGVYCTQCEPEGFRRITYFLDRPDVLSVYETRIEADAAQAPTLLGNGNLVASGPVGDGTRHYALWRDPHPKPTYLFALVGGTLAKISKPFTTKSGRTVEIAVHVEPGKEGRAGYALDALERSMRWDEEVFGREYDLDVFNIVAVSDFNMGAMENKGLNIFNDKYVLASPETATDTDYANIEAIVAHEYFHNWTGNRITCRDWFQLCLKEGLTVYRDQEFSSDMRSRPVHRIAEVRALRLRQFAEDAGPLAHPVRPSEYREINNFYTATVYEKGAEVIRMLRTLLGEEAFAAGMDLFFTRCDNSAATVEDFLACFAQTSGRDLAHFALWYAQAGTPRLAVTGHWDEAARTYRLDFAQSIPATPGQPTKRPALIPIRLGLVAEDGREIPATSPRLREDGVFVLDTASDSLVLENVAVRPVPSVLRGFSAPVRVSRDLSEADLLTLLRHDPDPFNRWQSAQTVAIRLLTRAAVDGTLAEEAVRAYSDALAAFLDAEGEGDPAFAALVLALPGEPDVAQDIGADVDPDAIHAARERMRTLVGEALSPRLTALRERLASRAPYTPDAASAGRRALRNGALDLVAAADPAAGIAAAAAQYEAADNMTDRLAALGVAAHTPPTPRREEMLADFRSRFDGEPLVLDKWFALQATMAQPDTLARVERLMADPAFSLSNPNRVGALIGAFALSNPTQFHRPDGAGYAFVADKVTALDGTNPQTAARVLTAFNTWRTMEPGRRAKAEATLRAIADRPGLSRDVSDIVGRMLG